jgi:hypothetical protein
VSEPAWVTIVVERKVAGRLAGGRCKPARPGARTKAGRRCTIWKRATTLIVPAKPGANSLPFAGMVGKRLLRAGAYRASLVAMDIATNKSAVRRAKLKLDTPPKKKRPRK